MTSVVVPPAAGGAIPPPLIVRKASERAAAHLVREFNFRDALDAGRKLQCRQQRTFPGRDRPNRHCHGPADEVFAPQGTPRTRDVVVMEATEPTHVLLGSANLLPDH